MRDIPKMYQNYTKITAEDEMGIADFIGDYLLSGKQIFGHNEHDKTPSKGNEVQFRHQAVALNTIFLHHMVTLFVNPVVLPVHGIYASVFYTGAYRNKLFRPPLA